MRTMLMTGLLSRPGHFVLGFLLSATAALASAQASAADCYCFKASWIVKACTHSNVVSKHALYRKEYNRKKRSGPHTVQVVGRGILYKSGQTVDGRKLHGAHWFYIQHAFNNWFGGGRALCMAQGAQGKNPMPRIIRKRGTRIKWKHGLSWAWRDLKPNRHMGSLDKSTYSACLGVLEDAKKQLKLK